MPHKVHSIMLCHHLVPHNSRAMTHILTKSIPPSPAKSLTTSLSCSTAHTPRATLTSPQTQITAPNLPFLQRKQHNHGGRLKLVLSFLTPATTSSVCPISNARSSHRRRVRCRQIVPPDPLHGRYFQRKFHFDNWRRLQDTHDRARRQGHQAPDLGYRWPGAVPRHHKELLPRQPRDRHRLRHHEPEVVREDPGVDGADQSE